MGFMAPFEVVRMDNHPYNRGSETSHGHFKDTPLRHPPYSAAAVPFAWLLSEAMTTLGETSPDQILSRTNKLVEKPREY